MKSEIQIDNNAGVCQIDIEGTIGVPEEWQFDRPEARVATYEKFRDAVRRIAEIDASEVVVNIRSTGGDVNDALLIHDALTAHTSRPAVTGTPPLRRPSSRRPLRPAAAKYRPTPST